MNRREWLIAAATAPSPGAGRVRQHGVFETQFQGPRIADPLEVRAFAAVRTPAGQDHRIPLFWDGGRIWRLRYSPESIGLYSYSLESSARELNDKRGQFEAGPPAASTLLDQEGAPRVAASRRHFEHVSGKPWFWLADTAWNGALLASGKEWDGYLAFRAAQRFTAVQFVLTEWRACYADEFGRTAFQLEGGRLSVDPLFFARMDLRVAAIRRHGLVPVPVMLWALSTKGDRSPGILLNVPQAIRLASFLNARYAAYGPLWMLGGDGNYLGEGAQRWKEIGRGVFSEVTRRPVTLHPGGMQDPWPGLKDETWLDFLTYQSGHGRDAKKWKWQLEEMPKGALLDPPRPVLDAEPNYEGHIFYRDKNRITDYHVRRASYTSLLLSPVAGVSYGAHGIWPWLRNRETPLNHPRSGEGDPFHECLQYPGAAQLTILRNVFERLDWWNLRPAPEIVAQNPVDSAYGNAAVAARTTGGHQALVYSPQGGPLKLDLSAWRSDVAAIRIDPRTGREEAAISLKPEAAASVDLPTSTDWLLHLKS